MKERTWLLGAMALAAPLLVALSLGALLLRSGSSRLQALPPLLIGSGLLLSSVVGRRRRRRHLLQSLRQVDG
jgi:hypothetical protein